jgi:transcriptional regulator with XRE-family HTH domain
MFSAARILDIRKSKGWSQEVLAEQSGISLRTIQRVEQGETMPRGYTLQALADALDVPLEALRATSEMPRQSEPEPASQLVLLPAPPAAPRLRADPQYVQLLNLSALSFLVLPLLNLLLPWLLWRARRHDTEHVAEVGRRVLGFQVLWQVASFFAYLLAVGAQFLAKPYGVLLLPGALVGIVVLSYVVNTVAIIQNARQLSQGNMDIYHWHL